MVLFVLFLGIVVFAAFYLRDILFRRSSRPYSAASPGISRTIGSRRRRQASHKLGTIFAILLGCITSYVCICLPVNCASRDIAAMLVHLFACELCVARYRGYANYLC